MLILPINHLRRKQKQQGKQNKNKRKTAIIAKKSSGCIVYFCLALRL